MFGIFGIVRRIGCAIILLLLGAALYATKATWLPKVKPHLPAAVQELL